jgi:Arc/MetJ-type ribon-helix-helix transcriptional regulator
VLDVAARDLDGHANTALRELFDRRLHRTAIVPALQRAAADPEEADPSLEEPDEEQDDGNQGEDATTDVHRVPSYHS